MPRTPISLTSQQHPAGLRHTPPPPARPHPAPTTSQPVLLLHFRVLHLGNGIRGFCLLVLQMLGPHVVHPIHQIHLEARPPSPLPVWGCPSAGLPHHLIPSLTTCAPLTCPPTTCPSLGLAWAEKPGKDRRGEALGRGPQPGALPQSDA